MGCHHVLPVVGINILGFRPFAVGLAGIDCIFCRFALQSQGFCHQTQLAAAVHHKTGIPFHAVIIFDQNLFVTIQLPEAVRNQDARIGPANTAIHSPHIEVHTAVGRNLGKPSILLLPVVDIIQILPGKCRIVK